MAAVSRRQAFGGSAIAVDHARFVTENLRFGPVEAVPEISIYRAHPGAGLGRLAGRGADAAAPFWAFAWAGGVALARYILDRPETVRGQRVLDFGAGSGLVAIAAARAGARTVLAAEIDPFGAAAVALNAARNGVAVTVLGDDAASGAPPSVDLVLAGDVFYDARVAARSAAFLGRCTSSGSEILVGDPGRPNLPLRRLRRLAWFPVADFAGAGAGTMATGAVYRFSDDETPPAGPQ